MILKLKNRRVEVDGISGTIDEPVIDNAFYLDGEEEDLTEEEIGVLEDRFMDELSQALADKHTGDVFDRMTGR